MGLLIGVLPLYGFHLPLCIAVCWPLRLDLVVAYTSAHISIPPVVPFLLLVEVELGSLLLSGHHLAMSSQQLLSAGLDGYAAQLAVGSGVLGILLGGLGALATWLVARRFASPSAVSRAVAHTTRRYAACPTAHRSYVAAKLATDPAVSQLAELQPPLGRVLDAGCGRAQFALLLLELGHAASVLGFDADERKVRVARAAAQGAGRFWAQGLTEGGWPQSDTVLLVDVLHYLPPEGQSAALALARSALAEGGQVVVREADRRGGLAALVTRAAERCGRAFGVNRGQTLAFRSAHGWRALLEAEGFEVTTSQEAPDSLLTNVLIIARPKPGNEPS